MTREKAIEFGNELAKLLRRYDICSIEGHRTDGVVVMFDHNGQHALHFSFMDTAAELDGDVTGARRFNDLFTSEAQ